ncbi:divalent metal ion transporter [Saccharomycopsis crataegensis]|uniref:Divalent metal ion transporter n=1 Tax=Saccharomycopsis crataegensis TaxID=43959 RepID=A0AAV5QG35_9ASCO|nr:divalent metal ion transporter [Saccharomycopsis crataegensis]
MNDEDDITSPSLESDLDLLPSQQPKSVLPKAAAVLSSMASPYRPQGSPAPSLSLQASSSSPSRLANLVKVIKKYISFLGPGIMVSVSFMDPGNYSTSVTASKFQYKLLFSIFVANIMAIFLQSLCAKLGAVTGLDLAQNCKKHISKKWNLTLYVLTEVAIIATDLAEVIGTAISLNILFGIPLFLGVVLTIIDVLIVLMAYRPNGPMIIVRIFEAFVSCLVLGTVICFAVELVTISNNITVKEIINGFLPSKTVIENDGLYISLAILGATVMPHSLYLGSGLVQPRLKEYDIKMGNYSEEEHSEADPGKHYVPSIDAINETMGYTITELVVSLFTVALFVNSAILIIAAATFKDSNTQETENADLFTIYNLLSANLSRTAGTIFALALLFSGLSAGVVCTLAGQMVSEGFLDWTITPSLRRTITRSIAIVPCLVLSLLSGREGLSNILNFSQVVLSFLLPIVSAPLIYFTNSKRIMKVGIRKSSMYHQNHGSGNEIQLDCLNNPSSPGEVIEFDELDDDEGDQLLQNNPQQQQQQMIDEHEIVAYKDMSNGTITKMLSIIIWLFITILNFYLVFSLMMGKDIPL